MKQDGFANIEKHDIDWDTIFVYSEDSPSGLVWKTDRWRGNVKSPYIHRAAGSSVGSLCKAGYYKICMHIEGVKYVWQAHRIVYEMRYGKITDKLATVDHKDGDSANNRVDNLRLLSKADNARNASMYSNNTSGVVGVYYYEKYPDRVHAKWMSLDGHLRSKSFSTNKYGYDEAFRLACEYRLSMISELNEQGAGYSERHGT